MGSDPFSGAIRNRIVRLALPIAGFGFNTYYVWMTLVGRISE